jgi:heme/copper-type cytochrome/quinol oxidase subunit 2
MLFDDKFHPNMEWVGLALTYIVFLVSTFYLSIDLLGSPKNEDAVMYIFIFAILFIAVSISIYVLTFYILYYRFSNVKQNIKLNRNDKNNFDTFKRLFVSAIVLLYILSIFFFTLYKDPKTNKYDIFFDIHFFNTNKFPVLDIMFFIIKVAVSLALLGISSYMVYLSTEIYNAKDTQVIYSSPENEYNIHKNDISNTYWIFRNLNMNYLLNYKFDVGLPE